jgi:hypothetical protein
LAIAKMIGFGCHAFHHVFGQRARWTEAEEDVGTLKGIGERARGRSSTAWAIFHWFMPLGTALIDHALGIGEHHVAVRNSQ